MKFTYINYALVGSHIIGGKEYQGAVVFVCEAPSIFDADNKYRQYIGHIAMHIGCLVEC